MTEIAAGTQPAFVSADGRSIWWGNAWVALDPRAISPDRRWIMLAGQWRPLFAAPAATGHPVSDQPSPIAPYQQPPRPGHATALTNNGRNRLALAGLIVGCAGIAAAIAVGVAWSQSSSPSPHQIGVVAAPGSSSGESASPSTNGYDASMKSDLRTVAQEVESQNVDQQDYTQTTFGSGQAAPGASITGTQQTVGDNTEVSLSRGNSIQWVGATSTAFCVKATSMLTPTTWYYDSAEGGITQTACTAGNP